MGRADASPLTRRVWPVVLAIALSAASTPRAHAQTVDPDLDSLLDAIVTILQEQKEFSEALSALISLAAGPDIGASNFETTNTSSPEEFKSLKLPFGLDVALDDSTFVLALEFSGGFQTVDESPFILVPDLLPGRENVIDAEWRVYDLYVGVGTVIPLQVEGLRARPLIGASLGRVQSESSYSGPDADLIQDRFDKVVLNWHADTLSLIPALQVEYEHEGAVHLLAETRVSHHHVRTFSRDGFRNLRADWQTVTTRLLMEGGLGISAGPYPLGWRLEGRVQAFPGRLGEVLPFTHFFDLGSALSVDLSHHETRITSVRAGASIRLGPNLRGWGVGVGLGF